MMEIYEKSNKLTGEELTRVEVTLSIDRLI